MLHEGPLPGTVIDFWRLVWQEDVHVIAMVTNIVEHVTVKCEKYWPESESSFCCGPIQVSFEEQCTFPDYIIRTFHLRAHMS